MLTSWVQGTIGSLALLLVLTAPAYAKPMAFEGTVSFAPLGLVRTFSVTGTGVATVNGAGDDIALHTLSLAGGITGTAVVPVTDPEVASTIASIRLQATLGAGVFHPFSAAAQSQPLLTQNILPLIGGARVCLVVAGCGSSQEIFPFQQGAAGIGVGGMWTGSGGGPSQVRVSVQGAPWTLGTALLSIVTAEGNTATIPEFGAAHGPLSLGGSTALAGGEIQLVTPLLVTSGLELSPFTGFVRTTLRFIPEPEGGLLVGSGALALLLIGRQRIQPRRTR